MIFWQKIISFFNSDFESVFAKHPTGKILSFVFYPKVPCEQLVSPTPNEREPLRATVRSFEVTAVQRHGRIN